MREWTGFIGSALRIVPAGVVFLLILLPGICGAEPQGGIEGSAANTGEVVFEGWAGPGKDATGAAIADAEKNVLLETVRPVVHPALFQGQRSLLTKALMDRRREILEGERLISSETMEQGGVKVVMAARVKREVAEDVLLKNLPPRMILFASASAGGTSKGYVMNGALSSAARKKGYKIVDIAEFNDELSKNLISRFRSGDREAARPLCLYLLARVIVEGRASARFSERTGEIYSSRADGSVRLTRAGETPVSFAVHEVKGFGSNESKANLDAVNKASAALASKVTKSLSGRQKRK